LLTIQSWSVSMETANIVTSSTLSDRDEPRLTPPPPIATALATAPYPHYQTTLAPHPDNLDQSRDTSSGDNL
jgi:hypothetical protein